MKTGTQCETVLSEELLSEVIFSGLLLFSRTCLSAVLMAPSLLCFWTTALKPFLLLGMVQQMLWFQDFSNSELGGGLEIWWHY